MPSWIDAYFNAANPMFYPVYGLSLFFAGLCMPISADLVLLTAGYFAYRGQAEYSVLIVVGIFSILGGDTIMFWIGHRFGKKVIGLWPFRKAFTPERVEKTELSFRKQGYRVVFLARFMPGIRTVFMFTSGTLGLRYWRFIAFDFAGAAIVIPGILYLVKFFAGNVAEIRTKLERGQWMFAVVFAVATAAFFIVKRRRAPTFSQKL